MSLQWDTSNCFFGLNLHAHRTFTSKKKYWTAYIKLLYHTGPPGLKNLYYLTNTVQGYTISGSLSPVRLILIKTNIKDKKNTITMKKYVHKLLTDCLNLSYIGTLSPQVSNDKSITISGSYGWN